MGTRLELNQILTEILGTDDNVYFQPPESLRINYPCIIYNRVSGNTKYADNQLYAFKTKYDITYIDRNPDSEVPDRLREIQGIRYDRHYVSNNLHHDVFVLYF